MRKIVFLVLISLTGQLSKAHNITSTGTGGSWGSIGTWVGGIVPGSSDTANIAGHVTVSSIAGINRVVVNSAQTLTISSGTPLYVYGEIINNGTVAGGYGTLEFWGSNMTVMAGKGTWTGAAFNLRFFGVQQVIDSTVRWINAGPIVLNSTYLNPSVINKGRINQYPGGYLIHNVGGHPCSFTNAKNAYVLFDNAGGTSLGNSYDTLHASATGDTCQFVGTSYTIIQPYGKQYYNLIFSGTLLIPCNLSLHSLMVQSGVTLNLQGYNLNLSGNWTDDGTITNNTGTITFDGIGSQCILRPSGTESFKNITIDRGSKLGKNCTVSISGTLTAQPGTFMDCTCP
jgi:hypothetical protein